MDLTVVPHHEPTLWEGWTRSLINGMGWDRMGWDGMEWCGVGWGGISFYACQGEYSHGIFFSCTFKKWHGLDESRLKENT